MQTPNPPSSPSLRCLVSPSPLHPEATFGAAPSPHLGLQGRPLRVQIPLGRSKPVLFRLQRL
eukprot:355194-Chlamydomonas_euryale.AAC.3